MSVYFRKKNAQLSKESVLVDSLGIALIVHAGLMYYVMSNDDFKRVDANEQEQKHLLGQSDESET